MRVEIKTIVERIDTIDGLVQTNDGEAVACQNIVAESILFCPAVALEREAVLCILGQDVLYVLQGDLRFVIGIGFYAKRAPGEENVTVLVVGKRELPVVAIAFLVGREAERPEEEFFFLYLCFYFIQDGVPAEGVVANAITEALKFTGGALLSAGVEPFFFAPVDL